ncbi:alanine racemase [Hippea maritima]|uniref:Alanine racemase n=1 Tax=Hippea maritima (strain ATCC 700847 / DSM 10411 / MH2) TaxID=760142 RepID=F2LU65_HIPMA|nr:alanine racemase [Hippea maritima]AEA34528.1 Alanine racemase [Hippea maritima DSM 10411]
MNFHSRSIVHLDNLHYNFGQISQFVGKSVNIIPVIKADAYGHGIVRIAKELSIYPNVAYLGIAHIKEGAMLRKRGVKKPILAMSCLDSFDINTMHEFSITPVAHNITLLERLIDYAKLNNTRIKLHLKFDTGMARLGIREEETQKTIELCKQNDKYIEIDGLMSHFSDSESDAQWTKKQLNRFKNIIKMFYDSGIYPRLTHIANSGAILSFKDTHLNCVRPGLAMYGYAPAVNLKKIIDLKPVLEIQSQLINIHVLKKGEGISYSRTFVADKDMKVGVVAFGYADGLPRSISNKFYCIVNGQRSKSIGTVCMDMFMCDLTDIEAKVSDDVIIMGQKNGISITADELAQKAGTISYEILTNIGKSIRVKRVYKR